MSRLWNLLVGADVDRMFSWFRQNFLDSTGNMKMKQNIFLRFYSTKCSSMIIFYVYRQCCCHFKNYVAFFLERQLLSFIFDNRKTRKHENKKILPLEYSKVEITPTAAPFQVWIVLLDIFNTNTIHRIQEINKLENNLLHIAFPPWNLQ